MDEQLNLTKISCYLCSLLRHKPERAQLHMNEHGWVEIEELLRNVRKYPLTRPLLEQIVREDEKGRYRISDDGTRIKCCQGHSIPWVQPELCPAQPPAVLYHGTTTEAVGKIFDSGHIDRMKRHHVHMHADLAAAWVSARRRRDKRAAVLCIDAAAMEDDGFAFLMSENDVWFTDAVPTAYIREVKYDSAREAGVSP